MLWIILAFLLGFGLGCAFIIFSDLWLDIVGTLENLYLDSVYYIRQWRGIMSYKVVCGDDVIWTSTNDTYGGQELRISFNSVHKDNLLWLQNFRLEHEKEIKLREENQAVKNAWEQYQVVKALAQKETV